MRFFGQFLFGDGKPVLHVSPEALQVLTSYSWPGNVWELKSAVESALIPKGPSCVRKISPRSGPQPQANGVPLQRQDERTRMLGALQQTGGNRSEAARLG